MTESTKQADLERGLPTIRVSTCDACAEEGEIVQEDPETEAWTCRRCWQDEELACLAGAIALGAYFGDILAQPLRLHEAKVVIDAYNAKHWERAKLRTAHNDGARP